LKTAILETPFSRMIEVAGIEGPIVLTITPAGVRFRLKGSQKEIETTWDKVIAMCEITFPNVPTYLVDEPFTFLQVVAQQMQKRKETRLIEPDQMVRVYKSFNPYGGFNAFRHALAERA
jgi:hypothetical protein